MVTSAAKTVDDYLSALPEDRRATVSAILALVRSRIPSGFEECMQYAMISWVVPRSCFPETYNGQPLAVASLAAQKGYTSLYLLGCYMDAKRRDRLTHAFAAAGKKLDLGKSCLRFKSVDDLALGAVGDAVASVEVEELIRLHGLSDPELMGN